MTKISIRAAQAKDVSTLIDLLRALFATETDFHFDAQKQRRGLELMLEHNDERCVFVAETEETVVGMCSVQTLISTAQGAPKAWIEDVCVHEEYRGRGIGTLLLNAVDDWCVSRGVCGLQLLCDTENALALHFYRRNGWQTTQLQCLTRLLED